MRVLISAVAVDSANLSTTLAGADLDAGQFRGGLLGLDAPFNSLPPPLADMWRALESVQVDALGEAGELQTRVVFE